MKQAWYRFRIALMAVRKLIKWVLHGKGTFYLMVQAQDDTNYTWSTWEKLGQKPIAFSLNNKVPR